MVVIGALKSDNKVILLEKAENSIGRSKENDVIIPHISISKTHCYIYTKNGVVMFRDNNSSNGTWINQQKISQGNKIELIDGDKIKFGKEYNQNSEAKFESKTMVNQNSVKDDKITLIDTAEYSKPLKDHIKRKQELLKKYFPDYLNNNNTLSKEEESPSEDEELINSDNNNDQQQSKHNLSPNKKKKVNRAKKYKLERDEKTKELLTLKTEIEEIETIKSKAVNELTKSVEKANLEIQDLNALKEEYASKINELKNMLNMESQRNKELFIDNKKLLIENNSVINENQRLSEFFNEKNNEITDKYNDLLSKFNSLSVYSNELQRKNDLLLIENTRVNNECSNLKISDIGKLVLNNNLVIDKLNREVLWLKKENTKLKGFIVDSGVGYSGNSNLNSNNFNVISNTDNFSSHSNVNINFPNSELSKTFLTMTNNVNFNNSDNKNTIAEKFTNILESYLKENKNLNKKVIEYENREESSNKKWNELIKENKSLIEETDNLKQQLNNQQAHYNSMIESLDNKLIYALERIPMCLQNEEKANAAKYLVEQMNLALNDKRKLLHEISKLEENIVELKSTNQRLASDLKKHLDYIYGSGGDDQQLNNRLLIDNIKKSYLNKIEELEDVITQQKLLLNLDKTIELEDTVVSLSSQIKLKENELEEILNLLKEYNTTNKNISGFLNNEKYNDSSVANNKTKTNLTMKELKHNLGKSCMMFLNNNDIINSLTVRLKEKDIEIIKYKNNIEMLEKQIQFKELNSNMDINNNYNESQVYPQSFSNSHKHNFSSNSDGFYHNHNQNNNTFAYQIPVNHIGYSDEDRHNKNNIRDKKQLKSQTAFNYYNNNNNNFNKGLYIPDNSIKVSGSFGHNNNQIYNDLHQRSLETDNLISHETINLHHYSDNQENKDKRISDINTISSKPQTKRVNLTDKVNILKEQSEKESNSNVNYINNTNSDIITKNNKIVNQIYNNESNKEIREQGYFIKNNNSSNHGQLRESELIGDSMMSGSNNNSNHNNKIKTNQIFNPVLNNNDKNNSGSKEESRVLSKKLSMNSNSIINNNKNEFINRNKDDDFNNKEINVSQHSQETLRSQMTEKLES